jgi:membrane-associated phospholipid phosphatase
MGITLDGFFVVNPLITPERFGILALGNPFAGADHSLAAWFHAHLSQTFVTVLRGFSEFGSSEWIGIVLSGAVLFFVFKRWWPSLLTLILAVPCGMLINEWIKILVHRHRPFTEGPFVDWSGYSFASGHTIGATLLYGQLVLFVIPAIKSRRWRVGVVSTATLFVFLVGFSRIALGAHYLTDVLAAMFFGVVWLTVCLFAIKTAHRDGLSVISTDILAEETAVTVPARVADISTTSLS